VKIKAEIEAMARGYLVTLHVAEERKPTLETQGYGIVELMRFGAGGPKVVTKHYAFDLLEEAIGFIAAALSPGAEPEAFTGEPK
jgi:hypothetical protein